MVRNQAQSQLNERLTQMRPAFVRRIKRLWGRLPLQHLDVEDLIQEAMIGAWQSLLASEGKSEAHRQHLAGRRAFGAAADALRATDPLTRMERRDVKALDAWFAKNPDATPADAAVHFKRQLSWVHNTLARADLVKQVIFSVPTTIELKDGSEESWFENQSNGRDLTLDAVEHEQALKLLHQIMDNELSMRDAEILRACLLGEGVAHVARKSGVTASRTFQIVNELVEKVSKRMSGDLQSALTTAKRSIQQAGQASTRSKRNLMAND